MNQFKKKTTKIGRDNIYKYDRKSFEIISFGMWSRSPTSLYSIYVTANNTHLIRIR